MSHGGAVRKFSAFHPARQVEALSMVCINVMGLDQIVATACGRGNRTPRALRPIVAGSVLNAIRTLGQACEPARRVFASTRRE
jgi:fumarate hydratase class II